MFGKKKKGKNKRLNDRLTALEMDMANNYKDAAQLDYKQANEIFAQLCADGELSAAEQAIYRERIAGYQEQLAHFTHMEGPGTGLFHK